MFDASEPMDEDVVMERQRVLGGCAQDCILRVENLTKVYRCCYNSSVLLIIRVIIAIIINNF